MEAVLVRHRHAVVRERLVYLDGTFQELPRNGRPLTTVTVGIAIPYESLLKQIGKGRETRIG